MLPVISDADFTCGNSQHPLDDVTRGEKLIKRVYEVLRASPHWENSVLIVTYDEHGGFYDHVAPPPAVPPADALSDPDNDHHHFTVGVASAFSAAGLWRGKQWGRRLLMVGLALNALGDLTNAIVSHDLRMLVGVPVAAVIIAYLASRRISRYFARSG